MRSVLLVVAFAAIVALALGGASGWDVDSTRISTEHLDLDTLCNQVGVLSGCSGCVHGTKGLCTWVAHVVSSKKRNVQLVAFPADPIHYHCAPTLEAKADLAEDADGLEWINATSLCPRDPTKEPIVRETYDGAKDNLLNEGSFERTSVFTSTWVDSDLSVLPVRPYAVDRTSFYGAMGASSSYGEYDNHVDCQDLHSVDLIEEDLDGNGGSRLLKGELFSELDKHCVRLALSGLLSTRCPAYGVAVSGLCQSFYDKLRTNCGATTEANVEPKTHSDVGVELSILLEGQFVVPDSTAFCINKFHIEASGHLESLAGLHIPTADLEDEDYTYTSAP